MNTHFIIRAPEGAVAAASAGGAGAGTASATATGAAIATQPAEFGFLDTALPKGWSKAAGVPESFEGKFSSLKAALGSHAELERAWGNPNKVAVPGPNATPAERAAFHKAIGVPDTDEGYNLAKPEKLKIGDREIAVPDTAWDKERAGAFSKLGREIGLTPGQLTALAQFQLTNELGATESFQANQKAEFDKSAAALKSEWGQNFDANLKSAQAGAKAIGLFEHPLAQNDPAVIKALAKVGQMIGERPAAGARVSADQVSANPRTEARRIQQDIVAKQKSDPKFKNSDLHKSMERQVTDLYQQATGGT